jgi:hypothetical protein
MTPSVWPSRIGNILSTRDNQVTGTLVRAIPGSLAKLGNSRAVKNNAMKTAASPANSSVLQQATVRSVRSGRRIALDGFMTASAARSAASAGARQWAFGAAAAPLQ